MSATGFRVGGLQPTRTVEAATTQEVTDVIQAAGRERQAIVVCGGGTMLETGNPPDRYDVELRPVMAGIKEFSPDDMTVTVEAGSTLAELNGALADHGQRVALDVPEDDRATIGGIASANAAGGLRYAYGTPRDLILGMTVIDGRARRLVLGGKVVKNVAGYDLARLLSGAYGTLGVITELTLRTHPVAESTQRLVFDFDRVEQADEVRAAIYASGLPLAAFDLEAEHSGNRERWSIAVTVEGSPSEVEHQRSRLAELAGAAPKDAGNGGRELRRPSRYEFAARATVPPDRLLPLASTVSDQLDEESRRFLHGHLGSGILRFRYLGEDAGSAVSTLETVRACCRKEGGSLIVEDRCSQLHGVIDAWGPPPAALPLMKGLKRKFDPANILSPGRFVGGI